MRQTELLEIFDKILMPKNFSDSAHNGLQVEGAQEIEKIIFGVTANLALIEAAAKENAQAIFVHHGLFWRPFLQKIDSFMKRRIKSLLEHDINLFAYHLPLDAHETFGNNAQIATILGLKNCMPFGCYKNQFIGKAGEFESALSKEKFISLIEKSIGKINFVLGEKQGKIHKVAICSGAAPELIFEAIKIGADAFICGEASEWVTSIAKEEQILFVAAGHHQTEVFGAKAICEEIRKTKGLQTKFIDIANPV